MNLPNAIAYVPELQAAERLTRSYLRDTISMQDVGGECP